MIKHKIFILALLLFSVNGYTQNKIKCIDAKPITGNILINKIIRTRIGPPKNNNLKRSKNDTTFIVDYIGFTKNAQRAFQRAVDIWGAELNTAVPIYIRAVWSDFGNDIELGGCGPTSYYMNFTNAPIDDMWYPIALAEKLSRNHLNRPEAADLVATFNSSVPWYLSLDGNTPDDQFDFVSVVLHEMGHGLGFISNFNVANKKGSWGNMAGSDTQETVAPIIFGSFVENKEFERLIDISMFENNSKELYEQLLSDNLYFNSTNSVTANNGTRPKLYAPTSYKEGSSVDHLDEDLYSAGDTNSLMTPFLGKAESIHNPGPVLLNMFADMGWQYTFVDHDSLPDTENLLNPISVKINIETDTELISKSILLHYSTDNFVTQQSIVFEPTTKEDEYLAKIPTLNDETNISYYISVADDLKRQFVLPKKAPINFYNFFAGIDVIPPQITHKPVKFAWAGIDSVLIETQITDNIGIDNAYIEYYINSDFAGNINLKSDTLDTFAGSIKFNNTTINEGDLIEYKIIAIDAASNSNSTTLPDEGFYSFGMEAPPDDIQNYENNFDEDTDDFILNDFEVITAEGFDNKALHSPHPYDSPMETDKTRDYFVQLKIPILIREQNALIQFDEVVLIEPGNGMPFTFKGFFDYVTVEASKDNETWKPLTDGYDSNSSSNWLEVFNSDTEGGDSKAIGDKSLFRTRVIDMLDNKYFSAGDKIFIRFRLYSDPFNNGWGWAIDNLKIQGNLNTVNQIHVDNQLLTIFPNPSNQIINIDYDNLYNSDNIDIKLFDINGRQLYSKKYTSVNESLNTQIDISNFPTGIYFVKLISDKIVINKKIVFSN